ncbi:hypothetical protein SA87_04760 [Hydrogenibacillus schlegelii]|uniref:Uncharacterized protein n=1 Tax=Hydrogenibacillus schlegelii TaxID=1484 RepID=A0A179IKP9_HYDSH|nr:hypothetical protein SA87_04760 [Hydrogenibacillus schlegelii]
MSRRDRPAGTNRSDDPVARRLERRDAATDEAARTERAPAASGPARRPDRAEAGPSGRKRRPV